MANLFQRINFTSHSGKRLTWKIECDALTDDDWATLALIYMESSPAPFGFVFGVPSGGGRFADALRQYADAESESVLVVDDVLTTGASICDLIAKGGGWRGLVAFDRSRQPLPTGVAALFRLSV